MVSLVNRGLAAFAMVAVPAEAGFAAPANADTTKCAYDWTGITLGGGGATVGSNPSTIVRPISESGGRYPSLTLERRTQRSCLRTLRGRRSGTAIIRHRRGSGARVSLRQPAMQHRHPSHRHRAAAPQGARTGVLLAQAR